MKNNRNKKATWGNLTVAKGNQWHECATCRGTGEVNGATCPTCGGLGGYG